MKITNLAYCWSGVFRNGCVQPIDNKIEQGQKTNA